MARAIARAKRSVVVLGRLPQQRIAHGIVLDPQLRAGLGQEGLDGLAGHDRLLLIDIEGRHASERPRFWKVIDVARQQDISCTLQLQVEDLVAGRMTRRTLDDDRPVAEHVVVISMMTVLLSSSRA